MKTFKILILTLFLLVLSQQSRAQENQTKSTTEEAISGQNQTGAYYYQNADEQKRESITPAYQRHWSFGGWFSMSFWNGGTDILIAPKAYYHVSPKFFTGFGITYIYSDFKDDIFDYHSNSIGGSVMAGVRPIPSFQLTAEYEGLNTTRVGYLEDTYWNNALYLGAAFVSGAVSFGVRYDVLYDAGRSAYGSAWTPVIGFYF